MVTQDIADYTVVEKYLKEALLLQGQLQALNDEKRTVIERVEKAKKWLQKQPEYKGFLENLQNILQQKNVGAFSELLSYFVKDVLQKDKDIVFELYTYHNLPALKIEASNNGNRESIIEGNGGSIANIVSTGLRLIALSRMTNRKFIVLDEPDCWLKPEHVPLFAKIIGEISAKLKIQTIIISHHSWQYFKDYGRVIELKLDGPHLTTSIVSDTPYTVNEQDDILSSIRMRRFMSHYDTCYDLHPVLTCIIGDNDIGKSVVSTALKAVNYGDSSDSYIMHHENEAQVIISTSKKKDILWRRFRETTIENPQKVKYTLYDNSQELQSQYISNDVPLFISEILNISTVEDIDIHIGNQKQPVFLLSSDVKPQERAKILSLGKDSLIIQKMMEYLKTTTKKHKQTEKEGEERFNIIERQITALNNIDTLVNDLEEAKTEAFYLTKQAEQISELDRAIQLLSPARAMANIELITDFIISEPIIHDTESLQNLTDNLIFNTQVSQLGTITYDVTDIELHNFEQLSLLVKELSYVSQIAKISMIDSNLDNLILEDIKNTKEIEKAIILLNKASKENQLTLIDPTIEAPQYENIDDLIALIQQLENQKKLENDLQEKNKQLAQKKIQIEKQTEAFINMNDHICPTCLQHIDKKHILGITHA